MVFVGRFTLPRACTISSMQYTINGFTVTVDDDFTFNPSLFSVYKNRNTYYCYRKQDAVFLHHLVLGKIDNKVIDHIDRNGLNNQKINLRFVSRSENVFNSFVFEKVKGVYQCSKTKKFYARIKTNGKRKSYGPFLSEQEAKEKYQELLNKVLGRVAEIEDAGETCNIAGCENSCATIAG